MSVLQRSELEDSPLADLHAIASELGLESFRTLRRDRLIDAILEAQGGGESEPAPPSGSEPEPVPEPEPDPEPEPAPEDKELEAPPEEVEEKPSSPEEMASGTLDVLPNGSGFLRLDPLGQTRDDVYVSPAQIRRCELRAGDDVSGPVRAPRRSERHPSLVHVETVNGNPAEPPEERPRFGDLTPVFPSERLPAPDILGGLPVGKGSRVAVGGLPGAGATRLLREAAAVLQQAGLELAAVLVGVRPEEVTEWRRGLDAPVSGGSLDDSIDAQVQAAELAAERAKRAVERGRDAVLVIDSLEHLPGGAARRVFGAARNTEEGGSLTVIASTGMAWEPQRQATTRVMLDPPKEAGGAPVVSASRSSVLREDLLGSA